MLRPLKHQNTHKTTWTNRFIIHICFAQVTGGLPLDYPAVISGLFRLPNTTSRDLSVNYTWSPCVGIWRRDEYKPSAIRTRHFWFRKHIILGSLGGNERQGHHSEEYIIKHLELFMASHFPLKLTKKFNFFLNVSDFYSRVTVVDLSRSKFFSGIK